MKQIICLGCLAILFSSCLDNNIDKQPTVEERLANDLAIIDAFLMENSITPEIDENSSLRYVVHEQGTGDAPVEGDTVLVNFEGKFLDGNIFQEADSLTFILGPGLIVGWRIGVPLIREGGSITLYVPSVYAWDLRGSADGTIPPGTSVIFDIDLLDVL